MCHDFRGQLEQAPKVADRLNVRAEGHLAREVAEVLTEERFVISTSANVLLSSPPQARIGRVAARGSRTASGT